MIGPIRPEEVKTPEPDAVPGMNLKLGGMALGNGIIFYTARNYAYAIRKEDGSISVRSGDRADFLALQQKKNPSLATRVVALFQSLTLLPRLKMNDPDIQVPFKLSTIAVSLGLAAFGSAIVRRQGGKMRPLNQELFSSTLALIPALLATKNTSAARYHGAEHKAVASIQKHGFAGATIPSIVGEPREHPRCGTILVAILLVTGAVSNWATRRVLRTQNGLVRALGSIASIAAALEVFNWANRNPENRAARTIIGIGLGTQTYLTTDEPGSEELEVSLAALNRLIELEQPITSA